MNDLNLTPAAGRVKCAKISGDTSGNYHPHGESVIYPTLVRMAQEWNMRLRADRQAGQFRLDRRPAAGGHAVHRSPHVADRRADARRPEARHGRFHPDLRRAAAPSRPCCRRSFPTCWSTARSGIAVGMATCIPPHNLGEVCDALVRVIDQPDVSIDELLEIMPGPDFPTGGIICGRDGHSPAAITPAAARSSSAPGRGSKSTARTATGSSFSEIPYQQTRDRVEERIAELVNEGRDQGHLRASATRAI